MGSRKSKKLGTGPGWQAVRAGGGPGWNPQFVLPSRFTLFKVEAPWRRYTCTVPVVSGLIFSTDLTQVGRKVLTRCDDSIDHEGCMQLVRRHSHDDLRKACDVYQFTLGLSTSAVFYEIQISKKKKRRKRNMLVRKCTIHWKITWGAEHIKKMI